MNASAFDPNSFLDATTTDANTRRAPLPVGDYQAHISSVDMRNWTGKVDPTKSGVAADLKIVVNVKSNPAANELPYDELTVRDSIMLDTTDAGTLDMSQGKNTGLRRYREALSMNVPGQPFSLRNMIARPFKVRIKHDTYQGEIQERVDSPLKA